MKRFSIVFVVFLTVMLTTVAVYAAPPEIVEDSSAFTREFEDCGDFTILLDNEVNVRITTYYNKDGNRVRAGGHVNGYHYLYREGYPENGLGSSWTDNSQTWFDPETGELIEGQYSGSPWNVHIPGAGYVVKISGADFFVDQEDNIVMGAGNFSYDADALCAYFES